MNKAQYFIASTLCIAFGLTFSFPLAMAFKPITDHYKNLIESSTGYKVERYYE